MNKVLSEITKRNAKIEKEVKPLTDKVIKEFLEHFGSKSDSEFEYAQICFTNEFSTTLHEYLSKR